MAARRGWEQLAARTPTRGIGLIYLAYDGSINGDWVARYAVGMAGHDASRRLEVVHVGDNEESAVWLQDKVRWIEEECGRRSIRFGFANIAIRGSVEQTLIRHVGGDADAFLICGARLQAGHRGYLSGTVAERLLKHSPFCVAAIRVVQPGLLGSPHSLLVPLAGHPRGVRGVERLLRLLSPVVWRVHVLRVMTMWHWAFRRARSRKITRLRLEGRRYVHEIESQMVERVGIDPGVIDTFVRVSDDWVKEILIHAGKHKSQLICLGASQRSLSERFFYGNPVEQILRQAPCDVAIYRGVG